MQPSFEKLRVAVIGCGYLGRFHAQKYARMPDVTLVGVVDSDVSRARAVADECGCRPLEDYRDLIGTVDAVSVVTPTVAHFAISRDLLDNDIHLLIEKPITATLHEADRLIELAREQDRIIQVGHLERFNPAVLALEGEVDRPLFIEAKRLSVFKDRATDVSVVLDLMIHDIDIILSLVKSDLTSVEAWGRSLITDHLDIAGARLIFADGCVANVTGSRVSPEDDRHMCLYQRDKTIAVDFARRRIDVLPLNGKADGGAPRTGTLQGHSFDISDALMAELIAFVRCVRTGQAPKVSGVEGRRALAVALQVMQRAGAASPGSNGPQGS